jgi:MoxR-like ATPase
MGDKEAIDKLKIAYEQFFNEIRKVIIGQDKVVEEVLVSIFSRGHCLLVGVPGLAKTLLVTTISKILGLDFKRIQFTPDLMPSDIIGTEILDSSRQFKFVKGPLFAHMILADEINRTPPKTQSALLEAMQEKSVTSGGVRYVLPDPFFVLATQNPIEQEGTYPLPEAQLDRFMLNILLDYPAFEDEITIVRRTTSDTEASLSQVISKEEILFLPGSYPPGTG